MRRKHKVRKLLESKLIENMPKRVYRKTNKTLSTINLRSELDNMLLSIRISLLLIIAGLINFTVVYYLAHDLWYQTLMAVASSIIFVYVLYGNYLESVETKIKNELPNLCSDLEHYYTHHDGNLIAALENTEKSQKPEIQIIVRKIIDVLQKENYIENMNLLKSRMTFFWLQILCTILSFAKEKGGKVVKLNEKGESVNVIAEVLEKMTNIIEFGNIQQGYDNAEMKQYELIIFLSPYAIVFVTKLYYSYFSQYIDVMSAYNTIEAKTYVSLIFLTGNLGTLFINWVRKNKN